MKYNYMFLIVLLTACGITLHHDISGGASVGINGVVTIQQEIDLSSLTTFFTNLCQQQLGPAATQSQITECTNTEITNFFSALSSSANKPSSTTGH